MYKSKILKNPLFVVLVLLNACGQNGQPETAISREEMLKIVRMNEDKFSEGVRTKNAVLLADIYSDSAQYVQPDRSIIDGKDSIRADWENFIYLKENPIYLLFNIHAVKGNREIIYETGDGYTLLADSTKWKFNYVNVWRLQPDGSYKLEVDTYSPVK